MEERRSNARRRLDRDLEEIYNIVIPLIEEKDFANITLKEIIDACTISKPTFYKIVPSKEALWVLLGIKGLNIWIELTKRSMNHEGYAREILLAHSVAHVIFSALHPVLFKSIFIANMHSDDSEVSQNILSLFDDKLKTIVMLIENVIILAESKNELKLPVNFNSQQFAKFIWNGLYGTASMNIRSNAEQIKIESEQYRLNVRFICDYLNWLPLSKNVDYEATRNKIINLYYKEEYEQLIKATTKITN